MRLSLRRVVAPLVLTTLLLGPVLFVPGYLLTYDMVWVPDLAVRSDFFGLGGGIPRAVPSDALVAVLDEVVPGMLLQKLVLFGSLVAGGVGIQWWVDEDRVTFGSTASAAVYLWNPYVVERLAIGHWPMLAAYGALPWLARAVVRSVRTGRIDPWLLVLLPVASLNASAGIAAGVLVAAFAVRRVSVPMLLRLGGVVLVANLPWVVAGLAQANTLRGVVAGADVFAPGAEGSLPAPLATLTLGGIWNAETVPTSRTTFLAWVGLVLLLAALVAGRRTFREPIMRGWVACAIVGWGLALLGWAAPGVIDALAASVPGAGVLRDGSRLLLLLAPLLAIVVGVAADRCVAWAGESGPVIGAAYVLLPLAMLPDAVWGLTGDLEPVSYPASYSAMQDAVAEAADDGLVLVLPFTTYRAPEWNHHRKVFDPVGRFQDENYLASDALAVSGRRLSGEDPRGPAVLDALALPTAAERGAALARIGVGTVVTDRETASLEGQEKYAADIAGRQTVRVAGFDLTALDGTRPSGPGGGLVALVGAAWLVYLGQWGWGCVRGVTTRRD